MRLAIALVLGGALALSGCDSDGGSEETGGSGGSAGTGGSAGSSGAGGAGGMNGGEAPVITMVEWSTGIDCGRGAASNYTVIVTATDADSTSFTLVASRAAPATSTMRPR